MAESTKAVRRADCPRHKQLTYLHSASDNQLHLHLPTLSTNLRSRHNVRYARRCHKQARGSAAASPAGGDSSAAADAFSLRRPRDIVGGIACGLKVW